MKVVIDDYRLEKMDSYTEPLEAKIKRQAAEITRLLAENAELKKDLEYYHTGTDTCDIESARAAGQNEAWRLAQKVAGNNSYTLDEIKEIFGSSLVTACFENNTYSEAAAKVAEWEKAKEIIKVGDEVKHNEAEYTGIVTRVSERMNKITIIFKDGSSESYDSSMFHKTGRNIDIDSFLKQIGGEE